MQSKIPLEWQCDYSPTHKHYFMNSWGSLRHYGYCGVCKYCNTETCTPQTAKEALENNYASFDGALLSLLAEKCGIHAKLNIGS